MTARRMRVRRGRVMHAVVPDGAGWLRSKCRRPQVRGVSSPGLPRAYAPADDWSADRYWYPDCQRCPNDEE